MVRILKRYNLKRVKTSRDEAYLVAANIAIKYGGFGSEFNLITQEYINEFWKYPSNCPVLSYFRLMIKVKTVKWYIHNRIDYKHDIWNSDFLHGLTTHGKIKWSKTDFPSFIWSSNPVILEIIKKCPFGGKAQIYNSNLCIGSWCYAPALYLKYTENTLSFVAGILAGSQLITKDKQEYAQLSKLTKPYLEKLGIPIEHRNYGHSKSILISPMWSALFTPKMPVEFRDKWLHIKKPFNANIYAPILWKTYVNSFFASGSIPYLKSTRMLFYEFNCEEGAMRKLDLMRVDRGLVSLHPVIKEMVKIWRDIHNANEANINEIPNAIVNENQEQKTQKTT